MSRSVPIITHPERLNVLIEKMQGMWDDGGMNGDLDQTIKNILEFRDDRDWKQFHNAKDMAISLSLEASEVLEHFQWKSKEEIDEYIKTHKEHIGEELADVLYWVLLMSHDLNIDILEASKKKLIKNAEKYPVEKAKGSSKKYNQF